MELSSKNVNKGGRSQVAFIKLLENNSHLAVQNEIRLEPAIVSSHDKAWDCWIVLNQVVYDVTLYLEYHPGGKAEIMKYAGQDATEAFNAAHPWVNFEAIVGKLRLGSLQRPSNEASVSMTGEPDDDTDISNIPSSLLSRSFEWLKRIFGSTQI